MPDKVTLTINFNDGTSNKFSFPRVEAEQSMIGTKINQFLSSNHVIIELDDELVIIPASSIKSMVVSPKPLKMPGTVIPNASACD
jgi:hypothetical protein